MYMQIITNSQENERKVHVTDLHLLPINVQGANSEVNPDGVLLLRHEYP